MQTRFGLHTGDTVVGNIGSPDRMNYTALGVSVNLAARLEGLNKRYGTQILVSESVVAATGDRFLFRPVDVAAVKGLSQRVDVYELCAAMDGPVSIRASERQIEQCRRWSAIYNYCANGDWQNADDLLREFVTDFPEDSVARLYLNRRTGDSEPESDTGPAPIRIAIRD